MTRDENNSITIIGRTNFRNESKLFGIKQKDRLSHTYIVGQTGTGKSTLIETMARQDLEARRGFALLDPHGDLAERVLAAVPESRRDDVIYFDVSCAADVIGFNPLERVPPLKRALAASGLLDVFKKIWADSWGPRLEYILRNAFLALLEQEEATLRDVMKLLDDQRFRRDVCTRVMNNQVRDFWLREYEGYPMKFRAEAIAPIQNKVGAFLANPFLALILDAKKSSFDLRRLMDDGKVLIVNLAKGKIGEDASSLLGAMLVSRIGFAALSRADIPEEERVSYLLYSDEFQSYASHSFLNLLSEVRKYGLGLVLAHQYTWQLEPEIREAILGNVGTIISFRIGLTDAELLREHFAPEFSVGDLTNLPNYHVYLRLMIDGVVSRPFSAVTVRPGAAGQAACGLPPIP